MGKRTLFGTDGIRGRANTYPMTVDIAVGLGRALAHEIIADNNTKGKITGHIIIGKDTRLSGYCFEQAISAGACSMGIDVSLVGPLPTPGIAYLTKKLGADAGVVVSASHNPYHDNGLKIFGANGFKLEDAKEHRLEQKKKKKNIANGGNERDFGKVHRIDDAVAQYSQGIISALPENLRLNSLRAILDCANGAAYKVGPKIFEKLGAKLITLGVNPDGCNINKGVGSLHPDKLAAAVLKNNADIGIGLDGDGDRVVLVDETGQIINGDALMALIAKDFFEQGKLIKNTLVATSMSNMGLENCLQPLGINIVRTDVGDRYVVERMRRESFNFGGEDSGHLIFSDYATTGDGLIGGLMAVDILLHSKKSLSELASVFLPLPRAMINLMVVKKVPLSELVKTSAIILATEKELSGAGRVFVRYSGTENKVRVIVEGPNKAKIDEYAKNIASTINEELVG